MASSLEPVAPPPMRRGVRVGLLCGGLLFSLWSLLILCGIVEVGIQTTGLLRVAHHRFAGERKLEESSDELDAYDELYEPYDASDRIMIELAGRLIGLIVTLIIELGTCFVYYSCYIKPTYDKLIPKNAVIPQDLLGRWKFGIFDCTGDCGTCLCFLFCHPCTMADLWYRAGWIHVTLDTVQVNCVGWQWCAGVCGYCLISGIVEGLMPCLFSALRGGIGFIDSGDGGFGDIIPLKKMFGMPQEGCGDFCSDCCLHCWCGPCIATQEYRQVMAVLELGPPQVRAQNSQGVVVGQAVAVGAPVQQAQPKM